MATIAVIEVLDRFGKVSERCRLDRLPFVIGRSYRGDLFIDDEYVSPEHLVVERDDQGSVVVRDNASTNGLFTLHPLTRHQAVAVEDNTRIRIGHTDIRFRYPDHPVRETVVDRNKPSRLAMIATNSLLLPLVWALSAAVLMGLFYLVSTEEVVVNALLNDVLKVFAFIAIWALAWSAASKIVTRRFFYAFHGIWASALIVLSAVIEYLAEYAEFIVHAAGVGRLITVGSELALLALLFYGHLRYASTYSARKSRLISATGACCVIGVFQLALFLGEPEFTNDPEFSIFVKPPNFVKREAVPLEDFYEGLSAQDFPALTEESRGQHTDLQNN